MIIEKTQTEKLLEKLVEQTAPDTEPRKSRMTTKQKSDWIDRFGGRQRLSEEQTEKCYRELRD